MGARGRPARVLGAWRGVGSDFGWHTGGVTLSAEACRCRSARATSGLEWEGVRRPQPRVHQGSPPAGGQLGAHAADTTSAFLLRIFLGNFFLHTVLSPDPGGGCALALRPATLFWVVAECAAWPLFLPWEPPPPGSAGL